ncbi:MAG: hypothetical protein OEQ53_11175, partial [Saprospiraceae bacterium]|nr:hypothetical protein [Saprospiraceae bacterium]
MKCSVIPKAKVFVSLLFIIVSLSSFSCQHEESKDKVSHKIVMPPTHVDGQLQAMIEVPVGSNVLTYYNPDLQRIDTFSTDGIPNELEYLPYPVNQGFISVLGPDSAEQKLSVWILAKQMTAGEVLAVAPIGLMEYSDAGIDYQECLMIPIDERMRVVRVQKFRELIIEFDPLKYGIEHWLRNRHGIGRVTSFVWKDERKAADFL